jgi:hypothetical protein
VILHKALTPVPRTSVFVLHYAGALRAYNPPVEFRVVQPWGRDPGRQSTTISEHATAVEAFGHIDALAERMHRTGVPPGEIELVVVNGDGRVVARPGAH